MGCFRFLAFLLFVTSQVYALEKHSSKPLPPKSKQSALPAKTNIYKARPVKPRASQAVRKQKTQVKRPSKKIVKKPVAKPRLAHNQPRTPQTRTPARRNVSPQNKAAPKKRPYRHQIKTQAKPKHAKHIHKKAKPTVQQAKRKHQTAHEKHRLAKAGRKKTPSPHQLAKHRPKVNKARTKTSKRKPLPALQKPTQLAALSPHTMTDALPSSKPEVEHLTPRPKPVNASPKPVKPKISWTQHRAIPNLIALSVGPAFESAGKNETFYLQPNVQKSYIDNKQSSVAGFFELFGGWQKQVKEQWLAQLGLAVATSSNFRLDGQIWEDANPSFNNYKYHYSVSATQVLLKGKLISTQAHWWASPYLSAGVGLGFTVAQGFQATPLICNEVAPPPFADNLKTSFSYAVGAGLQKTYNEHLQLGLGYQFTNWGSTQLGRAETQTLNSGLSIANFYTNGLIFTLGYTA